MAGKLYRVAWNCSNAWRAIVPNKNGAGLHQPRDSSLHFRNQPFGFIEKFVVAVAPSFTLAF